MHLRGRRLKFTAVLGFVVLSLTGFTGHGHGHHRIGKSHGGGGGGCSSSSQDHDASSSNRHSHYDDDDYGATGSGGSGDPTPTAMPPQDAITTLVSCASAKRPYATVEVTNPNSTSGTFSVGVTFKDAQGGDVDTRLDQVEVPANGTVTVRAYVGTGAARVDHCDLDGLAPPVS